MTYNTDAKWQKGVNDQKADFAMKNTATECSKKVILNCEKKIFL